MLISLRICLITVLFIAGGLHSLESSNCLDGLCRCSPGYVDSLGLCLAKLGSKCSVDSECASKHSVCLSGTCHCHPTRYPKDESCYKFATRVGFPVDASEGCRHLKNSVYSSESCQCAPGFVEKYGECLGSIGSSCSPDSRCASPGICSSGTCSCPHSFFTKDNQCHRYRKNLHDSCVHDEQCLAPYSKCSNGICKCKIGYAEYDNKCYGLKDSKCNLPTDCAGLDKSCKLGICSDAYSYNQGKLYSSKPGTTAIYQPYLSWNDPDHHDHHLGEPGHDPGPEKAGNLAWVKSFTLDRVLLVILWNDEVYPSFIGIVCRAKNTTGKFVSGHIVIPDNGRCRFNETGIEHSTDDWAVLVDLGPI